MTLWPPALRGWEEELAPFPREVALSLGPLLHRLAAEIGPMRVERTGSGRADAGFGGLSQRGAYERLLMSEWLLADELPDEFDRRAVMHEHLFLSPLPVKPDGTRAMVVLVDTGPGLVGTPRLGVLATLLVLARRARMAGVPLRWRPIGAGDDDTRATTEVPDLRWLASMRTTKLATKERLERALALVEPKEQDDAWVVGSAETAAISSGSSVSTVSVEDVLEPAVRRLDVVIHAKGSTKRALTLELPGVKEAARIVQDPGAAWPVKPPELHAQQSTQPAPSKVRIDSSRGPVFSLNGHRLFVVLTDGSIEAHHLPSGLNEVPGRVKRLRALDHVRWVAVTLRGKRVCGLGRFNDGQWLGDGLGPPGEGGKLTDIRIPKEFDVGLATSALLALHLERDPSTTRLSGYLAHDSFRYPRGQLKLQPSPRFDWLGVPPPGADDLPRWMDLARTVGSRFHAVHTNPGLVALQFPDGRTQVFAPWHPEGPILDLDGNAS